MQRYCLYIFLLLCASIVTVYAQTGPDLPQRTAVVRATQKLNFGDMTILAGSSGGTITVDYNGLRTHTGSVILLNIGNPVQQAIFEVKICPGRLVNVTFPSTITLTGSNGGSMLLHLGPTSIGASGSSFISNKGCDDLHFVSVGGTLDVGAIGANPAGLYSGTFSLTFVQQ
ncbi:MAG: DUF4402 domain-containing protein [Paludibacter sp.]